MSKQPEALLLANILEHQIPSIACLEVAATELRRLHEVNAGLLRLLIRYRHETPLGSQLYMAALEADTAIAKAEGEQA